MTETAIAPKSNLFQPPVKEEMIEQSGQKSFFLSVLFAVSLAATLLAGQGLWIAAAGWAFLCMFFLIDLRFSFYALFFFAAWFQPAGFFSKSLIFSLKHFQLAFLLSVAAHAVNRNPLKLFRQGIPQSKPLYPVLLLLGIGVFNFFRLHAPFQALRITINVFFIMLALFYLMGIKNELTGPSANPEILKRSILLFILGVVAQAILAFQNTIVHTDFLDLPLFHNNHLGILCAFTSFYALGLFLAENDRKLKWIQGFFLFILLGTMIASCSRTAWFSFLISFAVFLNLGFRYLPAPDRFRIRRRDAFHFILLAIALLLILGRSFEMVGKRFEEIPRLFDWKYWQYTLADTQNFGFLGILRLRQMYALKDILRAHPLLGTGFLRSVTDFHGLYFCVLAATGFSGLLLMAKFCRDLLSLMLERLRDPREDSRFFFLRLGSYAAFLTWLFCSFMETYFVQFSAWITVWMVLAALQDPRRAL